MENKVDEPGLHGSGPGSWWGEANPSGVDGLDHHGTYHYTYGNDDAHRTNWATWTFCDVSTAQSTQYEVWVWVPRNHATAEVSYKVHLDGCVQPLGSFPVLDQHAYGGWVKAGRLSLGHVSDPPSSTVTIEVNDNEVADPHVPAVYRSIGVDAALLVTGGGIGWDAVNSNHLITDQNCFGDASTVPSPVNHLTTFAHGEDTFEVRWSAPANNGGSRITEYAVTYSRPAVGDDPAWNRTWTKPGTSRIFRPKYKGVTYTVEVVAINADGQRGYPATTTGVVPRT